MIHTDGIPTIACRPLPEPRARRNVEVGEPVLMLVSYSEAAIAYGIAGERHWCKLIESAPGVFMAKVARGPDNWAGIFTPGELGFMRDYGFPLEHYCYPEGI